jgi:hypothetical protein
LPYPPNIDVSLNELLRHITLGVVFDLISFSTFHTNFITHNEGPCPPAPSSQSTPNSFVFKTHSCPLKNCSAH